MSRELKKQHSIESIEIEPGKNETQKIIRISFDSVARRQGQKVSYEETEGTEGQHSQSRTRKKYEDVVKRVSELGQTVTEEERHLRSRMEKISSLMGHLEEVNQAQER